MRRNLPETPTGVFTGLQKNVKRCDSTICFPSFLPFGSARRFIAIATKSRRKPKLRSLSERC